MYGIFYSLHEKELVKQFPNDRSEFSIRSTTENPSKPPTIPFKQTRAIIQLFDTMPPGTPREDRFLREAREYAQEFNRAEEVRLFETFQRATQARGFQQYREAREEVRGQAGRVAQNEPELVLNRATTLLACICFIHFRFPYWSDSSIADYLSGSFPEMSIHAHDVDALFRATCRNRPGWVRDMRHVNSLQHSEVTRGMLDVLQHDVLANLVREHQERSRDPRAAIRYLWDLVGVPDSDRY